MPHKLDSRFVYKKSDSKVPHSRYSPSFIQKQQQQFWRRPKNKDKRHACNFITIIKGICCCFSEINLCKFQLKCKFCENN